MKNQLMNFKTILFSWSLIALFLLWANYGQAAQVIAVTGGERHSAALKDDGTVWTWGENGGGQLGAGIEESSSNPVQVIDPEAPSGYLTDVISIAAGTGYWLNLGGHTLALKNDGTVMAWGYNWDGQLGDGTKVIRSSAVQVLDPSDTTGYLTKVSAVGAGDLHSMAVKNDGTVLTWGSNSYGQLGNGTTDNSSVPVQVSIISDVMAVTGGAYHSVALKDDGTVWAWGSGGSGRLGNDSTFNQYTPVQVSGLTDVTAIAAGDDHSMALKKDGTVWTWGYNGFGQLGIGTTGSWESKATPVQVLDSTDPTGYLTGVNAIAAGDDYSMALKLDGTVWTWGANNWGQLGDGTTEDRNTLVQVSGLTDVIAIGAGNGQGIAVKNDGTVWAWGGNWSGQLGNGTTEQSTVPVQVIFLEQETKLIEVRGPYFITPGEETTFLVHYENTRDVTLEDVVIAFEYPFDFTYVSSTGNGLAKANSSQVVWNLGDIDPEATGNLAAKFTVPWGLPPHYKGSMAVDIGAKNLGSSLDPEEYLDYEDEISSVKDLTDEEIETLLSSDEALRELLSYSTDSLGYVFQNITREIEYSDGSKLIHLSLLDLAEFNPVFIYSNGQTALIEKFNEYKVSRFDTEGGYSEDLTNGSYQAWGTWAEEQNMQTGNNASFTSKYYSEDDLDRGRCMANCVAMSVPDWMIEKDMMKHEETKKLLDCQVCSKSVKTKKDKKGKPVILKFDQGACKNCAFKYYHATVNPGVFKYQEGIAFCYSSCSTDSPNKWLCFKPERSCEQTWGNYAWDFLPGYDAPVTVAVAIPCVNGKLDESKTVKMDCEKELNNEYARCKNGICFRPSDCATAAPLPPYLPKVHMYSFQTDNASEICENDCQDCLQFKDFEIVVAHDPNEKSVDVKGNIIPGGTLKYTIEYENEGQGTAYDVFILDELDPDLDQTSLSINDGGSYSEAGGLVSWEIGEVPAGGQGQVTFSVQVKEGLPDGTDITNYADVHFPSASEITPTNPVVNIVGAVTAEPQTLETTAGTPLSIVLTGSGSGSGTLDYRIMDEPLYGSLTGTAPNVTYTSMDEFSGQDEFYFLVTNGQADSDPARVIIKVNPNPADDNPPEVTSTYPQDNATDVHFSDTPVYEESEQYNTIITAVFSEQVDSSTVSTDTFKIAGLTGTVYYNKQLLTAYFVPSGPLNESTVYKAHLTTGIKDLAGNQMASEYTWQFTTKSSVNIAVALPENANTVDFGDVLINTTAEQKIASISSTGMEDLKISAINVTGPDAENFTITEDDCSGYTLTQFQNCTVKVGFIPKALGTKAAALEISSNDPDNPILEIPLAGNYVETFTYTLTVVCDPSYGGNVSGEGIECPDKCSAEYDENTEVTLTAYPNEGYLFYGWDGGGCDTSTTCSITITDDIIVTAMFGEAEVPSFCPLQTVLSGKESFIVDAYAFRDRVLEQDLRGLHYKEIYYNFSHELTKIFLSNPTLLKKTSDLLTSMEPQIKNIIKARRSTITENKFQEGIGLIDELINLSDGELRNTLEDLKKDIEDRQWLKQLGIDVR